ncbi:hypothetical protein AB0H83_36605 [Dactylosporangium sp. NPDC050688]|uniref:hypothetical protein n=1 Tax=Dactylosporangium sp. NPDC050688 TaxID=3157217 RepID=UPI003403A68C
MTFDDEHPADFDREFFELVDSADGGHLIRADVTWLLSGWTCVFGSGSRGIRPGRPEEGCCSNGAYLSGAADRARVDAAVVRLTAQT